MQRVTTSSSPFTLLQQRLKYVSLHPDRNWNVWVENVPQWEKQVALDSFEEFSLVSEYAPCEGYPFLLDALHHREHQMYGISPNQEQMMVTNGALHALSLIFRSLYRPNAVVLCQGPILGSVGTVLQNYGFKIKYFSSHQGEVDIERLAMECEHSDVRLIYINTPHNPTGDILSEHAISQLVDLVHDKDIKLVADMIYDSITFDGAKTYSPIQFSSDWRNIYTVNSMSKNYGSPGLRIGWIVSDHDNIKSLAGFFEQECVSISGIPQKKAQLLIEHGNNELIKTIYNRRKIVENLLSSFDDIQYVVPRGGTQFYVKFPVDDVDLFADFLLVNFSLAITTISNYQGGSGSYIRVPIIYPTEATRSAIGLISEGLKQFQKEQHLVLI